MCWSEGMDWTKHPGLAWPASSQCDDDVTVWSPPSPGMLLHRSCRSSASVDRRIFLPPLSCLQCWFVGRSMVYTLGNVQF